MRTIGLLLLAVLPVSPLAFSQAAHSSLIPASTIQTITLGNSAVALTGPWKFQPGDSPVVNGSPLYAQPAFDDAHWAPMDLTSNAAVVDLMLGTSGYTPGWTRRGYPDLTGYAWYRLRLRLKDPTQPIWLKMPSDFDDSYQIFANGRYVGQFGGFSAKHVTLYYSRPASFPLPATGPDGLLDLAIRFYMTPATRFQSPDVGGMHAPPVLGLASTVQLLQASEDTASMHSDFGACLEALLFLLMAPLALWAWIYNREEVAWLWLFVSLIWSILLTVLNMLAGLANALTITQVAWLDIIALPTWFMFWWYWFDLREMRWIPRSAWLLAAVITLLGFCSQSPTLGIDLFPPSSLHWFNTVLLCVSALYMLLAIVILAAGFRRDRAEALSAALPVLLTAYSTFSGYLLTAFHIPFEFFVFGLGIRVSDVANMLMIIVIGALALRRFLRNQVRDSLIRESEKKDLEQAQQLQQRVLVPDTFHSPAFSIESEYRPALTVGGDFYQTLSKPDGSLILVIGDVSGKGISAAMLVAVLVGAIRSQAEHSSDPSEMLAMLNRRMLGRAGGHFATCLAAEISPTGVLRIANAGHISPYRNGEELELEGALPLGITDDVAYSTQTFQLAPGDRLTFLTDGVLEATNTARELYGFDRTRDISNQPAATIMDHVLTFGQEDDITILGIQFATT